MKFHLDENVDPAIAAGLRRRGIDVTTTEDAGLLHAPDPAHIEYAVREGRVIVTQDKHFLVAARAGIHHLGIIYCKQQSRSIGEMIEFIVLVDACSSSEEMVDHVEFA